MYCFYIIFKGLEERRERCKIYIEGDWFDQGINWEILGLVKEINVLVKGFLEREDEWDFLFRVFIRLRLRWQLK